MRYLIIDKKQRIESSSDATYGNTRLTEELEKLGAKYTFATTDDIEISMIDDMKISVLGKDIREYTHIILRGHRLHKQWEYETKKILADYIDQHNSTHKDNLIKLQNIESFKILHYYDKLYIHKFCIDNQIPTIPTLYRSSGEYSETDSIKFPLITKDFTGENDLAEIDGKMKIKKNVYLVNNQDEFNQERLSEKDKSKFIIQKYLQTGMDIRVFVSNGKVVGGFKRSATEGFMTVKKGEYVSIDLDKDTQIVQGAEFAASKFKANFIAIDLMPDETGKLLLQEISFNPGFKAYETKTSGKVINIAKIILESF